MFKYFRSKILELKKFYIISFYSRIICYIQKVYSAIYSFLTQFLGEMDWIYKYEKKLLI